MECRRNFIDVPPVGNMEVFLEGDVTKTDIAFFRRLMQVNWLLFVPNCTKIITTFCFAGHFISNF